jgi:hypothetical protein
VFSADGTVRPRVMVSVLMMKNPVRLRAEPWRQ